MARTSRQEPLQTTHNVRAWRQDRGLTLEQLAEQIGMTPQNLGRIERGLVPLGEEHHQTLARALGLDVPDLFRDPGAMPREPLVPIIGRVGADSTGEIVQTDAQANYDMAPLPPGGSPQAAALEVEGDSMPWLAPSGALVFFENQRTPPAEDMVYNYVIAELEDGRVLLKRLLRGSEPGLWTLESQSGPPMENVKIRWAAEPTAIIPPKHARRIIRRAGESQVA